MSTNQTSRKRAIDQISSVSSEFLEEEKMGQANKKRKINPVIEDTSKQLKKLKLGGQAEVQSVNKLVNLSSLNKLTPRIILWFRNDLRLHDNYVLQWAIQQCNKSIKQAESGKNAQKVEIVPVFCFDPRIYSKKSSQTKYGTRKTGLVRSRFQLETVECLRKDLQAIDSDLILSNEEPEVFLPKLLSQDFHNFVVYQQEICDEELRVEANVAKSLSEMAKKNKNLSVQLESVWGSTLYHIDDMPYQPKEYLPHIYGKFREKSASVPVRALLQTPKKGDMPFCKKPSSVILEGMSYLPKLEEFGFTKEEVAQGADQRQCYPFHGGEEYGLKRMQEYIYDKKSVGHYNETRNQLIGSEYSSKLSPWFANGCLSIRKVYHATRDFQKKHGSSESSKVYIDELFWRDFNRYWCIRYGNKVFSSYGIYDRTYYAWKTDLKIVQRWREGNTGMPLVDSLMREMNITGFMPNRGRMVVACYLTMDLKQDWRYGAHHFEEKLIDHDVQSNYGGWNFSAGIGPGRVLVFNSLKQSKDFDKHGQYIKTWCPELKPVPIDYIHDPWNMPKNLQKKIGFEIGTHYPEVVDCLKYTNPEVAKKQKREQVAIRKEEKALSQQTVLKFSESKSKANKEQLKLEQEKARSMKDALEKHKKGKKK